MSKVGGIEEAVDIVEYTAAEVPLGLPPAGLDLQTLSKDDG